MKQTKQTAARFAAAIGVGLLGLLPCQAAVHAQTRAAPKQTILTTEDALKTLQSPDFFAIGGVGIVGRMSPGEEALRVVLKQKDALPLLRGLLRTANPAGKLYALLGLRQAAGNAEFNVAAAPFLTRKETVSTFSGCIGSMATVSVIANRIEKGGYILRPDAKPTPPSGKTAK